MERMNVEAEGSELILKNSFGDHVIIPKKRREEIMSMLNEGCHSCIDDIVDTLPKMRDYSEDGSLYNLGDPIQKEDLANTLNT